MIIKANEMKKKTYENIAMIEREKEKQFREECVKAIEDASQIGSFIATINISLNEHIPSNVLDELIEAGYDINYIFNHGCPKYIISWG